MTTKLSGYLRTIETGSHLSQEEAQDLLGIIIDDPKVSDYQIKAVLGALTQKKPTTEEIVGFVKAMRLRMIRIEAPENTIDMCGTGGDKSGTFNISTAASLIVAAGGIPVAKHGNRAATSKCGSADVLETLHVPTNLEPMEAQRCLIDNNFVFLFAPKYHPSLRRMSKIRKELGFPTIFNLLGPLLNPAGVKRQLIGTFNIENCELLASVIMQLDFEHVIVLSSEDGLDEASLNAPIHLFEIHGKDLKKRKIIASDLHMHKARKEQLLGDSPDTNALIITALLDPNEPPSPARDIALLNAALGFYVAGTVNDFEKGVELAKRVINQGKARDLLIKLQSVI